MRHGGKALLVACLSAWLAGCAVKPPPAQVVMAPPAPSPHDYAVDAAQLRGALMQVDPQAIMPSPAKEAFWIARTKAELAASPYRIEHPQLLVAVDSNPHVQRMRVILAVPGGPWQVIGGGKVSTGRSGRKGYYITPTGVFPHTDAILDYRALGTYNENHIRGLGRKGMRVWDFGWQEAQKGWHGNGDSGEIRLLMHATDPDYLEQRLGRPDSKGCVRISAAMNMFLDRHAVLDADYLHASKTAPRYAAILPENGDPSPYAGTYLVIFNAPAPS